MSRRLTFSLAASAAAATATCTGRPERCLALRLSLIGMIERSARTATDPDVPIFTRRQSRL